MFPERRSATTSVGSTTRFRSPPFLGRRQHHRATPAWRDTAPLVMVLDERPRIVIEHLEGQTVATTFFGGNYDAFRIQDFVKVGLDVVGALSYIHGIGLLHLDVKPSSVMWAKRHSTAFDFSVAERFDPGKRLKSDAGTRQYMAPEQAAPDRMVAIDALAEASCPLRAHLRDQKRSPSGAPGLAPVPASTGRVLPAAELASTGQPLGRLKSTRSTTATSLVPDQPLDSGQATGPHGVHTPAPLSGRRSALATSETAGP